MTVEEFNATVDLHADGLYRFILNNIKDSEKARDIVQDSFEKMWLKIDEIRNETSKSYLFTIAYRTMLDAIKKDKKKGDLSEANLRTLGHNKQYSDLKEILKNALSTLPEIQRTVVLLRDYEGYSYEEIGEITGLNEPQVKTYIFRARGALKKYIGVIENVI